MTSEFKGLGPKTGVKAYLAVAILITFVCRLMSRMEKAT